MLRSHTIAMLHIVSAQDLTTVSADEIGQTYRGNAVAAKMKYEGAAPTHNEDTMTTHNEDTMLGKLFGFIGLMLGKTIVALFVTGQILASYIFRAFFFKANLIKETNRVVNYVKQLKEEGSEELVEEFALDAINSMNLYLKKYHEDDDANALHFLQSEYATVCDKLGYYYLEIAADSAEKIKGEESLLHFNQDVDMSLVDYNVKRLFKNAITDEKWATAAYIYATGKVRTDQKGIEKNNNALSKQLAAAANDERQQSPTPKKEGYFDNRRTLQGKACKNEACGFMNGHTAYKCKRCGTFLGM